MIKTSVSVTVLSFIALFGVGISSADSTRDLQLAARVGAAHAVGHWKPPLGDLVGPERVKHQIQRLVEVQAPQMGVRGRPPNS